MTTASTDTVHNNWVHTGHFYNNYNFVFWIV